MSYFNRTKLTDDVGVVVNPASDESILLLRQLLQLLKPLGIIVSGSGRLSLDVNSITTLPSTSISSGTITTVGTITNQANFGGLGAFEMQFNMAHAAWNTGMRANITF